MFSTEGAKELSTKREPPPPKRRKISKTDAAEALLELSSSFTSLSSDITTHEDLNNEVPVSENNSVDKDDSQSQDEQKCLAGMVPLKIVSVSAVLYPRWPPLLKIEIPSNGQNQNCRVGRS
jgi:hypothetical protein